MLLLSWVTAEEGRGVRVAEVGMGTETVEGRGMVEL